MKLAEHRKLTRQKIIRKLHKGATRNFLYTRVQEFCRWVERCGADLKEWQLKPDMQVDREAALSRIDELQKELLEEQSPLIDQYNVISSEIRQAKEQLATIDPAREDSAEKVRDLKCLLAQKRKELARIDEKLRVCNSRLSAAVSEVKLPEDEHGQWWRWSYQSNLDFLILPIQDKDLWFRAPQHIVNPVLWLFNKPNPRKLTDDEQVLVYCALLAVAHDHDRTMTEADPRIYDWWSYPAGGYFQCLGFYHTLWGEMLQDDEKGVPRIEWAWDFVKASLPQAETAEPQKSAGKEEEKPPGKPAPKSRRWSTKSTHKKPDQVFKEARDRQIANMLSEAFKAEEKLTAKEIAHKCKCSPSTVVRSTAWQKRAAISDYRKPPSGSKNPKGDKGPHMEAEDHR